jgi:hypothetical protein
MNTQTLSLCLGIFGVVGSALLLALTGGIFWYFRANRVGSFRWQLRNLYLKQLAALACLFFLAMAASYGVLQEIWAVLYFVIACKTASWWLRFAINQRS